MENSRFIASNAIGVFLVILYILAVRKAPFSLVKDYRTAFISITVSGFAMCMVYKAVRPGGWNSPFAIAAVILGVIALLLVILMIFKGHTGPNINNVLAFLDYPAALHILFAIIIIKWGITMAHHFIGK